MELHAPDGTVVTTAWGGNSATIEAQKVSQTGTYYILCRDYYGIYTGQYGVSLTVYRVPNPPSVTTGSATNITGDTATLNGTVNPNGFFTTYYFQWGPTSSYGKTTPTQSAGSDTSSVMVSANLNNLTLNATYHYRIVANNSNGTSYGSDMTFKTLSNAMPWLFLLLGD